MGDDNSDEHLRGNNNTDKKVALRSPVPTAQGVEQARHDPLMPALAHAAA
jgi:hypothetical protein